MKKLLLLLVLMLSFGMTKAQKSTTGVFETGKNAFMLNGKTYTIRAAELHYSRIPRPYWDHRIKLAKAMGMNTVCILVEGMGRVNYGQAIIDRKGITSKVVLKAGTAETDLKDWQVFNLPVDISAWKC